MSNPSSAVMQESPLQGMLPPHTLTFMFRAVSYMSSCHSKAAVAACEQSSCKYIWTSLALY